MRLVVVLIVGFDLLVVAAAASATGVVWIHLCGSYTTGSGATWGRLGIARSGTTSAGMSTPFQCPPSNGAAYGMETIGQGSAVPAHARAYWQIDAPSTFAIVGAHTEGSGMVSYGVNQGGTPWGGGFYWKGGGSQAHSGQVGFSSPPIFSGYFGWQLTCGAKLSCDGVSKPGEISVLGLELEAAEASGPAITPVPGSLGSTSGWVRGRWPIAFTADGPSGACQLTATLAGTSVSQPVNEPIVQTTWHQCPAGSFSQEFDTASIESGGRIPLSMEAHDAAYDYADHRFLSTTLTRNVNIDNQPVNLALSGPTDAPSTAGTQYITASASAGPSGVAGISCSLDGAPYQFHTGSTAQLPVTALGAHTARCYAQDNATNVSGARATSPAQTWSLSIRQPSISTVSFSRVVDSLKCRRIRERVHIPAHWVTGTVHGKRVKIRLPAQTRTVRVVHCRPRIVKRRILIHGRWRRVRVVLLPHTVQVTRRRVRHGAAATVSGWLGTLQGNALGGQHVVIRTAADNGHEAYRPAVVTTTAPDGSWTAKLPSGPSRLIQASYGGSTSVEPSSSAPARVVVPASVRLKTAPRRTHWGGTIKITGQLRGGYVPPAGELVVLWIGWKGGSTEIGHLYARRGGKFRSRYTFLNGNGSETYRLWAATARESDYPWASSRSRKTTVVVTP